MGLSWLISRYVEADGVVAEMDWGQVFVSLLAAIRSQNPEPSDYPHDTRQEKSLARKGPLSRNLTIKTKQSYYRTFFEPPLLLTPTNPEWLLSTSSKVPKKTTV